jgi:hypothetical protein
LDHTTADDLFGNDPSVLPLPPLDLIQQVSIYAEMVGLSIGEAWQRLQADSVLMARFVESEALVAEPARSSSHWRIRGNPSKLNRAILTGLHRSVVRVIAPRRRPASRSARARRLRSTRRSRSPGREPDEPHDHVARLGGYASLPCKPLSGRG